MMPRFFSFYIALSVSILQGVLAQEQIIPPNAREGIVLKDFLDLQRIMNIGQYSTVMTWPLSNPSPSSTLTLYERYTPGLQQYPVVFSIENEEKTQHLSYFKLPSGGGGGTCLCKTTINFESFGLLPNQLVRLEIEETYRLEKRGSYNDGDVFENCPAENCIYHLDTRLAYILDTSGNVLRCLACDIPMSQRSYLEFYDEAQEWKIINEEVYTLSATMSGEILTIEQVSKRLTDEQQRWLGTYTLR